MDPGRWKSVVVPIDTYKVLRDMAKREHRTISGQFTFLLEKHQEGEQIYTAYGQGLVQEAVEK
jgi:macrodomain Ter protein organizer (MatP/YcbG family)